MKTNNARSLDLFKQRRALWVSGAGSVEEVAKKGANHG